MANGIAQLNTASEGLLEDPRFDVNRWGAPGFVLFGAAARTRDEAEMLADAVLADAGLKRTPWQQSVAQEWRRCNVPLPYTGDSVSIGASTGGVVAINGVPFLNCAQLCVTFEVVQETLRQALDRRNALMPYRVALAHTRRDCLEGGRLKWEGAHHLEVASRLVRDYIERNGLAPGDFAGGEVWKHNEPKRRLIGFVKFNGKIWSGDDTRLVWQPEGSEVAVAPPLRAPRPPAMA